MARLSDDSAITELSLQERPLTDLIRSLYLRVLSRPPTVEESQFFQEYLENGYDQRRSREFTRVVHKTSAASRAVSWSNHLNPEVTRIKQEQERAARLGDSATFRLRPEWRERLEDVVWALVNSPEFVFVP